jgi:hypothetical protein
MSDELVASRQTLLPIRRALWRTPLVVGLCCGLGYGITNRLLALRLPGFLQLGQSFDVRPFPGTSLESLRRQFGTENEGIRGELDLLELEEQTNLNSQDQQKLETQSDSPAVEFQEPTPSGKPQNRREPPRDQTSGSTSSDSPSGDAPLPPQLPPPPETPR